MQIHFAWRTFRWDSETKAKAHVHMVVVGFSRGNASSRRTIYAADGTATIACNINGYLIDGPDVFIQNRSIPLSDVPPIALGSQPIDDGALVFDPSEMHALVAGDPLATQFIRPYMMGADFIARKPRYCLWLKGADPSMLHKCPHVLERIEHVREFRLASKRTNTLRMADTPSLFASILEPRTKYIAIPKVSSERRRYIPIDYLEPEVLPGDKLFVMQGATLCHFGVLTSATHMAWVRTVSGCLKSDYSYSKDIVYNNFPWPDPTPKQKERIMNSAQAILDARAKYPGASLADLYDKTTMPAELRRAHRDNDKAVMDAYGIRYTDPATPDQWAQPDALCVARLMELHQEMTRGQKQIESMRVRIDCIDQDRTKAWRSCRRPIGRRP